MRESLVEAFCEHRDKLRDGQTRWVMTDNGWRHQGDYQSFRDNGYEAFLEKVRLLALSDPDWEAVLP